MNARVIAFLICAGVSCAAYWPAHAATLTTLHTFTGAPNDGANPYGGVVVGPGGVLYGTTQYGGTGPCTGWADGCGTVFSLTPPATPEGTWTESIYSFPFPKAGYQPYAGVAMNSGGGLYGTTAYGGDCVGSTTLPGGTVFLLKPPSSSGGNWIEQSLLSFCGGSAEGFPLGASPEASPVIGSGVLYGTTSGFTRPGFRVVSGTVYSLTPPTTPGGSWAETTLDNFSAEGGCSPQGGLVVGNGGVLYGTTEKCQSFADGMVFSLTPPATPSGSWTETVLYNFGGGADGANPYAGVIIGPRGVLYGTTYYGGDSYCGLGCGTVFSLTPPSEPGGAWTEAVLYRFPGSEHKFFNPRGSLVVSSDGVLYGTSTAGGSGDQGTIFSLAPPASPGDAWTATILYSFTGGSDGGCPYAGLAASGGVLYGTTHYGDCGGSGAATVFSLAP